MGWDQPALVLAANAISKHISDGELDLSNFLVVTPGSRAGRILDSFLSEIAQARGVLYSSPQFLTPGRLIAAMYQLPNKETPPVHQQLAWIESLRTIPDQHKSLLVQGSCEATHLLKRYAELLSRTCSQLAGENIRPQEVPARAEHNRDKLIGEIDADRWNALEVALKFAEDLLRTDGGYLDSQRELAAVRAGPPCTSKRIVLVAVSEMAELPRTAFCKHVGPVECLIAAPPILATKFDGMGCVIPSQWTGSIAEINDQDLIFADGPSSQAEAVFSGLAQISPAPSPQDVVISAPDPTVTPHLKSISREIGGVRIRDAAAKPVTSTPACLLISNIADYCREQTFETYAQLVRHPHFESRLVRAMKEHGDANSSPTRWLKYLARYGEKQAPSQIDPMWVCESERDTKVLIALHKSVTQLLSPLLMSEPDNAAGTPASWANAIRQVLKDIYDGRQIRTSTAPGRRTHASFQAIAHAVDALARIPKELSNCCPQNTGDALQLVLDELKSAQLAPEPLANSIEVLGWLDAALDPAPFAFVTGMNEGVVPEKISTDPLLPESIASALRISCNDSRLGRDAYLLALMSHTRKSKGTKLVVVSGRRDSEDDPLWPSRLLLGDEVLVPRIERMLNGPTPLAKVHKSHRSTGASAFKVLPMVEAVPPTTLNVSHFKRYLTSPYEFYLDQVLRLEEFGSPNVELDSASFGNLIHGALKLFGTSPARKLSKKAEIADELSASLESHVTATFGSHRRPEVQIQLLLAQRRITRLAEEEAKRRSEGWTIQYCEWGDGKVVFSHNDTKVEVRGRIDRIDFNPSTETWQIIDYKTGTSADAPDTTHFAPKKNEWKDLQLPLYRHLASPIVGNKKTELAYLLLPRDPEETKLKRLSSKIDLAQADIAIKEVIAKILESAFAEPGYSRSQDGARGALLGLGIVESGGTRPPVAREPE